VLNTGLVGKRDHRFDPRKGGKVVHSLPKFPPFGLLRTFALAFFAILVTGFVLYRQLTLPKPVLFLPKTATSTAMPADDGLIYIDMSGEAPPATTKP